MPMKTPIVILLASILLTACAFKTYSPVNRVSYQIGEEQVAVLGVPFLTEERGEAIHGKQWEGILWGGMHHSYTKSDNYFLNELYYGGLIDNQLLIISQQTLGNANTPTRRQHQYDISNGDTIKIGKYKLQVITANNSNMKFRILGDREF